MSDNITRCPKCHTSFRVGEAHLNSAKGAVRCGSCLNVFNARENLIAAKKPVSADITSQTKASHESTQEVNESHHSELDENLSTSDFHERNIHDTTEQPAVEEDDYLISDNMEKEEEEVSEDFLSAGEGFSSSDDYDASLFERSMMDSEEDEDEDDDESWALNLLEDDDEDDASTPSSPNKNASENPHENDEGSSDESELETHDDSEDGYYADDDQPIYADFDEDINDEEAFSEDSFSATDDFGSTDDHSTTGNHDTPHESEELDEEYRDDYQDEEEPQYSNSFQIIAEEDSEDEHYRKPLFEVFEEKDEENLNTELANQYLESIEPEPVEFSYKTHSTFWQSKLLWGGLSLVAGIGIVFQVAWIKFDKWSLQQPYRDYYAMACNVLDCTLPVLIDRKKIKTANLVVRSHPKAANALIVDAILQNTAIFEQTFPVLDLVFTDSQEKVVAARRLNPRDYLGGELAGKTHMPIRQPIHIAIEIEDPGEAAVGYKISIAD